MKQFSTWKIDTTKLASMGWDLDLMSITNSKGRPFVVIAGNAKMVWLAPMTTQLGGRHGRVECTHDRFGDQRQVDVITTDMFPIHRAVFDQVAKRHGQMVAGCEDVVSQFQSMIGAGRLGSV